jgi:hypothetical protein
MNKRGKNQLLAEVGKCVLWGACLGLPAMVVAFGLIFTHWDGEDDSVRPGEAVLLWPLLPILVLKWWPDGKRISIMVALQVLGYALVVALVRLVGRTVVGGSIGSRTSEPEA